MNEAIQINFYDTNAICAYLKEISTDDTSWIINAVKKNVQATIDGKDIDLETVVTVSLTVAPGKPAKMSYPPQPETETAQENVADNPDNPVQVADVEVLPSVDAS